MSDQAEIALAVSEQNDVNAGLVRLWCSECRRYGDHMAGRHPTVAPAPHCHGHSRFDTLDRAEHLMSRMVEEFGGTWRVMKHAKHFHIVEVADDV